MRELEHVGLEGAKSRLSRNRWNSLWLMSWTLTSGCVSEEAPRTEPLPAPSASESSSNGSDDAPSSMVPPPFGTPGGPSASGSATPPSGATPNASAKNPIVTHVFTADPSADVYEGRVYVFTSHDPDDQDAYDMVDYHAFSSDDLVNWQDHGVVLDSANISWTDRLYAPDTCYDEATGKYYLYFPNSGSAIGVAVSDVPGGPYVDAIGQPLINSNTPGAADVDWLFDPTCFIDDDGQAYLYFGGGPSGTGDNARVIRLGEDMTSLADDSATTIVAPDFFEASFMHKRDGRYYYSYSTGFDRHAPYIDYMISDAPMSGFEYVGTILPTPAENNGDNNHHSMLEYEGQWYIFYHNRVLANQVGKSNFQRSITLDKMSYDEAGLINQVPAEMGVVQQLRSVDAFSRIEAELIAAEEGIETGFASDGGQAAGVMVTQLHDGDWVGVSQLYFRCGASRFVAHVASDAGGSIVIQQGGCEGFRGLGTEIGSCQVPATGGGESWTDVECAVQAAAGVHDLCLLFAGGAGELLNLDHYHFE
jgi:arabinoxylan arabinofuranohydrolase